MNLQKVLPTLGLIGVSLLAIFLVTGFRFGGGGSDEVMDESVNYKIYSEDNLREAHSGRVVLFFHADWCPTCRMLEEDILENGEELPDDVTVLKVDYDSSDELRDRYGVVAQHTLVQLDDAGEEIVSWRGGNFVEVINMQIEEEN